MFKNLIRFRLLDFFTLITAIAIAIGFAQAGGWREHEKPWLIGALITGALLIWCATRIGKTSPTPGLFLASYTGALYGLADVSPWVILLGLDRIESWLTQENYRSGLDQPHLENLINPPLLALLMGIPTLLFGAAWKTLWTIFQWTKHKLPPPASKFDKLALIFPVVGAFILIGLCIYFPMRPQIRHVRTIRIPFEHLPTTKKNHYPRRIAEIPSISAWTITPDGKTLYALRENRQLFEVDAQTNKITRRVTLQCGELSKTREFDVLEDGRLSEPVPYSNTSEGRTLDHFEQLHPIDANTLLLVRRYGEAANCMSAFDLRTGAPAKIARPAFTAEEKVYSLSQNGRFLITYVDNEADIESTKLTLWNLSTLAEIEQFVMPRSELLQHQFAISTSGVHRSSTEDMPDTYYIPKPPQFLLPGAKPEKPRPRALRPHIGFSATESLSDHPQISDDGEWIAYEGRCYKAKNPAEEVMINFRYRTMTPTLDKRRNRLILLPPDWRHDLMPFPGPHFLFGASRLDKCYPNQLILFDLKTKSQSTAIFRQGLLKRPNAASTKFYDDGRYLVIADEDNTADLFHVFAMP